MKNPLRSILALLALGPAALVASDPARNCGCKCCTGKEVCCCHEAKSAEPAQPAPGAAQETNAKRHLLKGVIVDILADKSALLVKHEAIPGYMGAMTMLFQVDAATLRAAVKGQAITGTLVERDDGFWLEDVQVVKN